MRAFFQNIVSRYRQIRERVAVATAPVRSGWSNITAPVRQLFFPLTSRWANLTAPIRNCWAAFRQRNPVSGNVLGFFGSLIKWGFYFLLFLILSVWIGLFGSLPTQQELRDVETANSTAIFTADSIPIGKYFIENRTDDSLKNVSPYIINALIATEDKRFLEHSGIDLQSWVRVGMGVLSGKEGLGGGSTLSQQLAKNLYPRKNYHIPGVSLVINKIRENFISVRLEKVYSKQDLLRLYLNTVPFGNEAFGINVASRQFFNKMPKDLTVDQAATLVGMLKGTTIFNPIRNPEKAQKRRNVVLYQMVRNGHLTQKEYDELSKKPVGAKKYNVDSNNDGPATYFREYLRTAVMPKILDKHLKEDGTKYNLYTDGLKIYTTLNSKMQRFAEESVAEHMRKLQNQFDKHWKNYKQEKAWGDDKWIDEQIRRSARWESYMDAGMSKEDAMKEFEKPVKMTIFAWKNSGGGDADTTMSPIDSVRYYFCMLNCGFMAMETHTGYIRSWVGGTKFKYFKFDHNLSKRQVGSTFKPIVYSAAIQDSIKPCDYFPNQIKKIVDWEPHNADEKYGGYYTLGGALTKSVNVVAAQLIEKVGIQKTIDLARNMGVTATLPREYGISLGACDIALYDMLKVYGTIGNQGKRPEPVLVLQVVNRDGEVIYDYKEELAHDPNLGPHVEALTTGQASIMTELMQNVINQGTGRRLRQYVPPDSDFAGKTGTTQNHADGWFICFNPQLVTGAWVGGPSPAVRFRSMDLGQGSAMALPIVGGFWNRIAKDGKMNRMLAEKFPDPKPEIAGMLGCYPWVGIEPDSFNLLMQDSVFRDSVKMAYANRNGKAAEPGAGETDGVTPEDKLKEGEQAPEEKKEGVFKKIFGRKEDEKKPTDKKDQKKDN